MGGGTGCSCHPAYYGMSVLLCGGGVKLVSEGWGRELWFESGLFRVLFSCFLLLTFHGFKIQQRDPVAGLPGLARNLVKPWGFIFWGICVQVWFLNG